MLYEVLAPGYHSPLTKTQIVELFRAGRLGRDHRCKPVSQKEWRTVDELFPLLKYRSATYNYDETYEEAPPSGERRSLVLGCVTAACLVTALWVYFGHKFIPDDQSYPARITETRRPQRTSAPALSSTAIARLQFQRQAPQQLSTNSVVVTPAPQTYELPSTMDTHRSDLAAQQREAQERQRQQAELTRLQQERATQEVKARGQNVIIPLDQEMIIYVGGLPLHVKIHDNDVTSFDVWINGASYREVPKQKGISQTGTDETFIYSTGRARLYYVWEPSEKVNHCLLRIRED
jgi:hypothetical protein